MYKLCRICNIEKPLSDYAKCKSKKDGLQCYCKPCHNAMKTKGQNRIKSLDVDGYNKRRRDSANKSYNKQKTEDPVRLWSSNSVRGARARAKRYGLPVDLTLQNVIDMAVDVCPVMNTKLRYSSPDGYKCDDSATIDRIVPEFGYLLNNVRVISEKANRAKSNATLDEVDMVLGWVEKEMECIR